MQVRVEVGHDTEPGEKLQIEDTLLRFAAKAANEPRSGRCPQRHWFGDLAEQCVPRSARARIQEAVEVAAAQDLPDTVGVVSEAPAGARRAVQAVFPIQGAAGLS